MEYLAYIAIIGSLLSFFSTMHSWFRVSRNNADIDSIRDLTGIIRKSEITRLFGNPNAEGNYSVNSKQLSQNRTTIHKMVDDPYFDVLCFIIAWISLLYPTLSWIIIPTFIYVIFSWGYVGYLAYMNRDEIFDE